MPQAFIQSGEIAIAFDSKLKKNAIPIKSFKIKTTEGLELEPTSARIDRNNKILLSIPDSTSIDFIDQVSYSPSRKKKASYSLSYKNGKKIKKFSASISSSPGSSEPLADSWVYGGHTYQLIKTAKSWEDAAADAILRGGYLVEIDDLQENTQLYGQLRDRVTGSELAMTTRIEFDGGGTPYVWLGGTDREIEGSWIWSNSRKPITTTTPPWGAGPLGREPDDGLGIYGSQDGLAMGLSFWPHGFPQGQGLGIAGEWNDRQTNYNYFYVIEYNTQLAVA